MFNYIWFELSTTILSTFGWNLTLIFNYIWFELSTTIEMHLVELNSMILNAFPAV